MSYIRAEREWHAGTTASSAKGGRPTRTLNLAYRSSSLSLLEGGRPEDTAVGPGGNTTTPLAGVTLYLYNEMIDYILNHAVPANICKCKV